MGEGKSEPRAPTGDALPLIMVPTSAGAGGGANGRCLVWHPEDEVLVPMAEAPSGGDAISVRVPWSYYTAAVFFFAWAATRPSSVDNRREGLPIY